MHLIATSELRSLSGQQEAHKDTLQVHWKRLTRKDLTETNTLDYCIQLQTGTDEWR